MKWSMRIVITLGFSVVVAISLSHTPEDGSFIGLRSPTVGQ